MKGRLDWWPVGVGMGMLGVQVVMGLVWWDLMLSTTAALGILTAIGWAQWLQARWADELEELVELYRREDRWAEVRDDERVG